MTTNNRKLSPYAEMSGYEEKTTFWNDFTVADQFGPDAVKDTYKRAFSEWNGNTVYLTELTMVLNWKIWDHYQRNETLARVYNDLWEQTDAWACEHLSGEDRSYFFRTTD